MSEFTYTVPAGMFKARTKAEANAMAEAYARTMAQQVKFCCELEDVYVCVGSVAAEMFSINLGQGPFTWTVTDGTMPDGLSMSFIDGGRSMVLSGVPTTAGNVTLTLRLLDSSGNELNKTLNIYVMGIVDSSLPDAQVGVAYSHQLTATGGSGSYYFQLTSGTLPDGLSLSNEGLISGVPTAAGVPSFQISLSDQRQNLQRQVTAVLQSVLLPCLGSGQAEFIRHVYEIVDWDAKFATLPDGYSNPLSPDSWGPDRVWHGNMGMPIAAPAFYWEAGLNYVFPDGTFTPNVGIMIHSTDGSLAYPNKPIAFYRLYVWIGKNVLCTETYNILHPNSDAAAANCSCLPTLWIGRMDTNRNSPEGTYTRESGLMSFGSLEVRLVS